MRGSTSQQVLVYCLVISAGLTYILSCSVPSPQELSPSLFYSISGRVLKYICIDHLPELKVYTGYSLCIRGQWIPSVINSCDEILNRRKNSLLNNSKFNSLPLENSNSNPNRLKRSPNVGKFEALKRHELVDKKISEGILETIMDTSTPKVVRVHPGGKAFLLCRILNLGTNSVIWYFGDEVVSIDRSIFIPDKRYFSSYDSETETWIMEIKDVRLSDEGEYVCQVTGNPSLRHIVGLQVIPNGIPLLPPKEMSRSRRRRKKNIIRNNEIENIRQNLSSLWTEVDQLRTELRAHIQGPDSSFDPYHDDFHRSRHQDHHDNHTHEDGHGDSHHKESHHHETDHHHEGDNHTHEDDHGDSHHSESHHETDHHHEGDQHSAGDHRSEGEDHHEGEHHSGSDHHHEGDQHSAGDHRSEGGYHHEGEHHSGSDQHHDSDHHHSYDPLHEHDHRQHGDHHHDESQGSNSVGEDGGETDKSDENKNDSREDAADQPQAPKPRKDQGYHHGCQRCKMHKKMHQKHQHDSHRHSHDDLLEAHCHLLPNSESPGSNVTGHITIKQEKDGSGPLYFKIYMKGFEIAENGSGYIHGFHIHENKVVDQKCSTAGAHFNPTGSSHGAPYALTRHVGDLGNIRVDRRGALQHYVITDDITKFFGPSSIVGRSIVVHEGEDDLGASGDPTGNAGYRLACCTIEGRNIPANLPISPAIRFNG